MAYYSYVHVHGIVYSSSWRCVGLYRRINIASHACYFPLSYQITKIDVDHFKPGFTIPSCLVWLEWTGGEQVPPQRLCHKVTLKGAKFPAFFHIRHDPQAIGGCNIQYSVYSQPDVCVSYVLLDGCRILLFYYVWLCRKHGSLNQYTFVPSKLP